MSSVELLCRAPNNQIVNPGNKNEGDRSWQQGRDSNKSRPQYAGFQKKRDAFPVVGSPIPIGQPNRHELNDQSIKTGSYQAPLALRHGMISASSCIAMLRPTQAT